jgi:hypothetical protein
MIYTHVFNRPSLAGSSPLDMLAGWACTRPFSNVWKKECLADHPPSNVWKIISQKFQSLEKITAVIPVLPLDLLERGARMCGRERSDWQTLEK